jgi:hypothetical protein
MGACIAKDGTAYFAGAVSYTHKMLMVLTKRACTKKLFTAVTFAAS